MYSADGVWANATDDDANITWVRDSWARAEPFGHEGRAYLNFPGHGEDRALTRAVDGDPEATFILHPDLAFSPGFKSNGEDF